jgi:hypothetical protein
MSFITKVVPGPKGDRGPVGLPPAEENYTTFTKQWEKDVQVEGSCGSKIFVYETNNVLICYNSLLSKYSILRLSDGVTTTAVQQTKGLVADYDTPNSYSRYFAQVIRVTHPGGLCDPPTYTHELNIYLDGVFFQLLQLRTLMSGLGNDGIFMLAFSSDGLYLLVTYLSTLSNPITMMLLKATA